MGLGDNNNAGLGGGLADLVSTQKGGVTNLSRLVTAVENAFPRINGTFTLSAATTTVVTQPSIGANAVVIPVPINATAALIVRTNGLFVSTHTAGTSFTMSTQAGSAVAGGIFSYIVINPS